jgi:glycosyltransferase involved in cell wall biosynthesis
VVHTYEWAACLNALLGTHLVDGTPLVASVMAMRVPRFMPRQVPLVVGTRVLHDELRRQGFAEVTLVEPPVDVDADEPSHDGGRFRRAHGLPDTALVLAIVSRLDALKNESTFMAIDAVERMANTGTDIRLVIAGGGSAAEAVHQRAEEVNGRAGRPLVVMTGVLDDPRGAYAASDVVLGMGGSALRGLAFAKPLIVVGIDGYAELFTPETSGEFLVQGFWGLGEGDHRPDALIAVLESLVSDQARREQLGAFGRRFVCERFSLTDATTRLEGVLGAAAGGTTPTAQRGVEAASAMTKLATIRLQAWVRRGGRPVSR